MSTDRFFRISEIFNDAQDLDPEERGKFLHDVCGDDADLRREVERLFAEQQRPSLPDMEQKSLFADDPFVTAATAELERGLQLGPYRLIRRLGEGGMGQVYLAERSADFEHQVAIKVARPGHLGAAGLARFRAEMKFMAELSHPQIATILDAGTTDDGRPYLVMEYVDGDQIDKYSDAQRLPIADRLRLFQSVCRAVEFAHQRGVIHRDLKPGNILVKADGTVKLIDFGIAKQSGVEATLTQTGWGALTPNYASPEQIRGDVLTISSDVYSLGVVLYELLTGERPHEFDTTSVLEIERVVCHQEPKLPSSMARSLLGKQLADRNLSVDQLERSLSGDLDNIAMMCLRKEPERRYQSVRDLSDDIERHMTGLPVTARAMTFGYRFQKLIRRNQLAAMITSLLIAAVVVGIIATLTQWRSATHANVALREVEQRQREQLYVAHMNLVQQAWEAGNVGRALKLLAIYEQPLQSDLRGFEWDYWKRMCNQYARSFSTDVVPRCLEVSPGGRYVAIGHHDGTITLRDVETGQIVSRFKASDSRVEDIAFSASGDQLAAISQRGAIPIWDLVTNTQMATLEGHRFDGKEIAFSPDGRRLFSGAGKRNSDNEVFCWDLQTEEVIARCRTRVLAMACSPDGKLVATSGWDHRVVVWNSDLSEKLAVWIPHESAVIALSFSPDSQLLVCGSADNRVSVWELAKLYRRDLEPLDTFEGHRAGVIDVAVDSNSSVFVSASADHTIKLWKIGEQDAVATLKGHLGGVFDVALCPKGEIALVSISNDTTIKFWRDPQKSRNVLEGHERALYSVAYSPDGQVLASAGLDRFIRIWDAHSGELRDTESVGPNRRITSLAFSPDGQWFVSGSSMESADFRLWRISSDGDLAPVECSFPLVQVRRASFSADSKRLAVVVVDQGRTRVQVWNLETGIIEREFESPAQAYSIAFSPTNKSIVTGDIDNNARIWDASTGRLVRTLEGHQSRVVSVAYSADGKRVATGSGDQRIGLWDAETGEHLHWLTGHIGTVWCVAFSPDGSTLASGGVDTSVRLWDIDTGEQTTSLVGHARTVSAATFSPSGGTLATVSEDSTVRLWHGSQ